MQTYLEAGDPGVTLASVAIAVGGRRGRRQIVGINAPCVPVGPVNATSLHVQVHGVYAHVGVTLQDLLVAPVWHGRVQAADFVVIGYVEDLSLSLK